MIVSAISPSRTNRAFIFEWWRSVDHITLVLFLCLISAGLILSMAASPAGASRLYLDDPFYFLYRQTFFATLGFAGAIFTSTLSPLNARRVGVLALAGSIVLLVYIVFNGHTVKGATRWIRLGSFSLQPSEIAKPAFVVFAAWMFSAQKRDPKMPGVLIVFALYLGLVALLILQPDFGQSFLVTMGFAAVFFFAGLSIGWMLFLMGLSLFGAVGAYFTLSHVRDRIDRFLNPAGSDTYQTDKALEAMGQGGLLGQGPGEGVVKYSIPDGHTDFIFSIMVEEFGFIISVGLIVLLAAFVLRCYRNALKLNDFFCQLAVAGLATLIGMQVIINLFVNLNLAPSKGMTLPFLSYGGSSMLAMCFTVGLILSFTRRRPGAYGYGQ